MPTISTPISQIEYVTYTRYLKEIKTLEKCCRNKHFSKVGFLEGRFVKLSTDDKSVNACKTIFDKFSFDELQQLEHKITMNTIHLRLKEAELKERRSDDCTPLAAESYNTYLKTILAWNHLFTKDELHIHLPAEEGIELSPEFTKTTIAQTEDVKALASSLQGLDDFDNDFEFIYQTIIEDHPGLHNNTLDPSFQKKLEDNYNEAKKELNLAEMEEDKIEVLRKFGQSFQDSHLWVKYDSQSIQQQLPEIPLRSYGIEELPKNVCWVHIPSFYPSSDLQKQDFQQIIEKLPALRDKTIIFDVRGNRGGSYTYGTKLIESLFSKIYAGKCLFELYQNSFEIWRVSSGNIKYMNEIVLPFIRQAHADDHSLIEWNERLSKNLEEAFLRKRPSYRQPLNFKGDSSLPLTENPIKKPIFVIVDRNCYSATLMFIDELKGMKVDITLIGEVTGADSMYMERKVVPLPSGKGKFGFPIYVYIGPSRGHNIPYYPDIHYSGDLQNTTEVQNFVLKLID